MVEDKASSRRGRAVRLALLSLAIALAASSVNTAGAVLPTVTVMTRNLYLGADLSPVIASPTPSNVEATFAIVQLTDFPARAEALADEIEQTTPDLIGLQEAVLWRTQTPGDVLLGNFTPNATTVAYDFIQVLLDKLAARGLAYASVAVVNNMDVELPGVGRDIRLTDRDAILARTDLPSEQFGLSNIQQGHYSATRIVVLPTGSLLVLRGWALVDVNAGGKTFRFITTHLELPSAEQVAQGTELLSGPASTGLPVILVGDFNSAAAGVGFATATYGNLISAGFTDAWNAVHPANSGFSWGQAESLDNPSSLLDARIDLVLLRGTFQVLTAELVGATPLPITETVRWPSDHAGVVVAPVLTSPAPTPTLVPVASPLALLVLGTVLGWLALTASRSRRRQGSSPRG